MSEGNLPSCITISTWSRSTQINLEKGICGEVATDLRRAGCNLSRGNLVRYIARALHAHLASFVSTLQQTASNQTLQLHFIMSNPVVFFDITAGGSPVGRIEMTVSAAISLYFRPSNKTSHTDAELLNIAAKSRCRTQDC